MAEQDYRPRNSAIMQSQSLPNPAGGDPAQLVKGGGAPGPAPSSNTIAPQPVPTEAAGGGRPVPKPRNRQPAAVAKQPAPPPYFPANVAEPPRYAAQYPPPNPGAEFNQQNQVALPQEQRKLSPRQLKVQVSTGCGFCTMWRGILEIVARSAVIVLGVFLLGLSPAIIKTVDSNDYFNVLLALDTSQLSSDPLMIAETQALIESSKVVAQFAIFLGVCCFLIEVLPIISRFTLRAGSMTLLVFHIVDAVASGILGVFFLGAGGAAASYSSQWSEPPQICEESFIQLLKESIGSSTAGITLSCKEEVLAGQLAGLAVWGFIGMGVAIFLIAWAIYALMAKWDHASNGYKDDAEANAEADANGRANN